MIEFHASGATHEVAVADLVEFFQHGWHSWCRTGWADPTVRAPTIADRVDRLGHADPLHAGDTNHGGSGVGAVANADGTVTLLGALAGGAWVHLEGTHLVGRYEVGDGPWVELGGTESEVFARYAELLAASLGRRRGGTMRLWSSWYSHYEDVTEKIVHETLDGLDGLDFDVVQVDDGWQQTIGDWEPNSKFPSGMADTAGRIGTTGRRAGLWLAPFIVKPESRLASEQPDWVLRDAAGAAVVAGENWGGPYWALDVTRPDTLDWLSELFAGLRGSGFGFFKLDFIYAGSMPGRHANPMSRSDAYRNACLRIRDAVGDDTYLLACGAPVIESVGVFDGIRIGPDVGPEWDNGTYAAAAPAMATSLHRLWLRPAIDPDPDVVYFRRTALSPATARRLQALAQITGFLGTSDPPDWLTLQEREALTAFLRTQPPTEQLSRYRWRVGDEVVDFAPALASGRNEPLWEEAG